MINISRISPCNSCANNPRVEQPDGTEATEKMVCDKYDPVPVKEIRVKNSCPKYKNKGFKTPY